MTKINVKLLTTSTTVIKGVAGDYTMKTFADSIDTRVTKPAHRVEYYGTLEKLAQVLGSRVASTLYHFFKDGHTFCITIKDYETPAES